MKLWPAAFQRLKDRANGIKEEWTPEQALKARAECKQYAHTEVDTDPQVMAATITGKTEQDTETGEMVDRTTEKWRCSSLVTVKCR